MHDQEINLNICGLNLYFQTDMLAETAKKSCYVFLIYFRSGFVDDGDLNLENID